MSELVTTRDKEVSKMAKQLPEGAITDIKSIKSGMMVKVQANPILHKCLSNDVYSDDGSMCHWGLKLAHAPDMKDYDEFKQGYWKTASYDYAHVDSVEYALPPTPSGYMAVARRDGDIVLIDVGD